MTESGQETHPCQTWLLDTRRRASLRRPITGQPARPRALDTYMHPCRRRSPAPRRPLASGSKPWGRTAKRAARTSRNDSSESALGHMKTTYGNADRGRDGLVARQGRAAGNFAVNVSLGSRLAFSVLGGSFTLEPLTGVCADHGWTRRKHAALGRAPRRRHDHESIRTSSASRLSALGRRRAIPARWLCIS